MPPRPKTAARSTATARTRLNTGVGHVLGPVTVTAPRSGGTSKRRKADYVEISSSSSSDGEPEPATATGALKPRTGTAAQVALLKSTERAKRQPSAAALPASTALPAPATLLPPPVSAVPTPAAIAPVASTSKRPRSPSGRTPFSSYPHEARISRSEVEQEWTLVPSPGRRILRDQVEQTARETIKDWSRKQASTSSRSEPPLSAKQLKSLQAALSDFANDFDQLLTGVPVPPLPSPLLTLDSNKVATSRKKARLKGETDGDDRDWVWSLEALEARIEGRD